MVKTRKYGAPKNWRGTFLTALAETSNISAAAEIAVISPAWAYKTRREDANFRRQWFEALAEGYDNLELELLAHLRGSDGAPGGEAGRKFDTATALRCLTAHRESVARERGRQTLADEVATIASINAKIDALRARAKEGEAAIRAARRASKRAAGDGKA